MEPVSRIFYLLLIIFLFCSAGHSTLTQNSYPTAGKSDFSPFYENGKVGLKNQDGAVIIPPQYEALGWSNGKFSVIENVTGYKINGRWGLLNTRNQRITKAEFEDLSPGQGSVLVARKKLTHSVRVLSGCITTAGKIVIPFQYDGLSISSLRAIVFNKTGNTYKHGLSNFENNLLIPLDYQSIYALGSLRYAVVNFDNKTAIFSEDGKQLTGFLIDSISAFKKNYAVIYQNQRQGVIHRDGEIKLEPAYREILIRDDGSISTRQADAWWFLNGENKLLSQLNADSVQPIASDIFKIRFANRVQLTDKEFKPLNDNFFSFIGNFSGGKAPFRNFNKTGMIRSDGSVAIPARFEQLIVEGDLIRANQRFENKPRWILIDTLGKQISQRNYEFIGAYNGKFFPVRSKNYWGALDRTGKEFIACVHDSIVQQVNDLVIVKFKGKYGIINTRENWIVTPQPNPIRLLNDDLYVETTERTKFLKSIDGNVIYFSQNPLEINSDHMLEYLPSGAIWKINLDGVIVDRLVKPEKVESIFPESEGLRAIKKDGRYGFIDNRGRLRIANRYEDVRSFSEGLAAAQIRGRWGFINRQDNIAIQPVYDEVFSFNNGYALVRQKDLFGLIDKNGKPVLPIRYQDIKVVSSNRFLINQDGLYGLAEKNGKMLIMPKYNELNDLNNGYVIVQRDGKYGLLTLEGVSTIPLLYDALTYDNYHNQYIALKRSEWEAEQ